MRPGDLTTLEAIDLANHPILADFLERGARHRLAQSHASTQELVQRLYESALSRLPTNAEAALATELLGSKPDDTRMQDLLWAVLMLPEFQLIR